MLDQRDRGRTAGLDRVRDVPDLVLVDEVSVGPGLGSRDGSRRHALVAGEPEPEQGADGRAEILSLVDREVAPLEGRRARRPWLFCTARASMSRMMLLSRRRLSSSMISPLKSGSSKLTTSSCTGPMVILNS